jgi:hypothetical protein
MGQVFSFIMSNLFTILIVGAIVYFIVRGKIKIRVAKDTPPVSEGTQQGVKEFAGNSGGIEWKLESVVVQSRTANDTNDSHWTRKTTWHTDTVKFPLNKFLMLMSAPGGHTGAKQIERGGLINSLINKAADFALDIYVSSYFGSRYTSLVSIGEDGVKIDRPALSDFLILTNIEPTASKFLDGATTGVIANWKNQKQGFSHEGNVDQFGLLFSPEGMILSCQVDMANEQEARMFADFGAVLGVKMKQVLSA